MGAWGYDIFDNGTAYDFTDEIKADAKSFFRQSFEKAVQPEYLGYDEGVATTVSAAYVDNLLNGTTYRTDTTEATDVANVNMFGQLYRGKALNDLLILAVKALRKVLSDNSDLNDVWQGNEELYPKWRNTLLELIDRLG